MTELSTLWLPILLSAVAVFLASSISHMASPWHRTDYPKMPNEDRARDALRPLNIPPGDYMLPRPASRADLRTPESASWEWRRSGSAELRGQDQRRAGHDCHGVAQRSDVDGSDPDAVVAVLR